LKSENCKNKNGGKSEEVKEERGSWIEEEDELMG